MSGSPPDMATHRGRAWLLAALVAQLLIALVTCGPVLDEPKLDPDDYRYLHHLQELERDFSGSFLEASTVENRWDHIWWLRASEKVRFYRPTVVLSYWLDAKLWRDVEWGLLFSNVVLHLLCCWLAALVLLRSLGAGLPHLLASALFAAFWCHGEVIWYVAGRTDTLAALGFLAGLALHVHAGPTRGFMRWLALPCYAFAFLSKELAVALPLVCALHDLWIEGRADSVRALLRREWRLYASHAAVAIAVQVVRSAALAGSESALVYPYFVSPWSAEFPAHLWTQVRSYGDNLLLATSTKPFQRFEDLEAWGSAAGIPVALAALATTVWLARRDRRLWWLAALAVTTWAPTSFVYLSERYLYLPSVAVAGALGVCLARLRGRGPLLFAIGVVVALAWIGHQGTRLRLKNESIGALQPRQAAYMQAQLARDVGELPRGARVLILNLPGDWLTAQFAEPMLCVMAGDPTLEVRVLSVMPTGGLMGNNLTVRREGEHTLYVAGGLAEGGLERSPLLARQGDGFPWLDLGDGTVIDKPRVGFRTEVVRGAGDRCEAVRFHFPRPLDDYVILRWLALDRRNDDLGQPLPALMRQAYGRVERVR